MITTRLKVRPGSRMRLMRNSCATWVMMSASSVNRLMMARPFRAAAMAIRLVTIRPSFRLFISWR
ncbi:hypothetical protein D1872_337070 [compost metagenome]